MQSGVGYRSVNIILRIFECVSGIFIIVIDDLVSQDSQSTPIVPDIGTGVAAVDMAVPIVTDL